MHKANKIITLSIFKGLSNDPLSYCINFCQNKWVVMMNCALLLAPEGGGREREKSKATATDFSHFTKGRADEMQLPMKGF